MRGVATRAGIACALISSAIVVAALGAPFAQAHDDSHEQEAAIAANECVLLARASGPYVARSGDGFAARTRSRARATRFRAQVTGIGRTLLVADDGHALAAAGRDGIRAAGATPGRAGDWSVSPAAGDGLVISDPVAKRSVAVARDGSLTLVPMAETAATRLRAEPASGCITTPEISTSSTGEPGRGATSFGAVQGFIDTHVHGMAFEFLGGKVHCGRPFSPQGVTVALVDCPDHAIGNGAGAVLENFLSHGSPVGTHDPVGWPTFKDWPRYDSLTHEQTYYKWIERTWRGGLRMMVNLMVENEALCDAYPLKQNRCDDMTSVRLQIRRARELEAYIDAQAGGPGKGWYRIVTSPWEARRVVNEGKLAVVLGIEVSSLFGCDELNDEPACTRASIDRQLEEVHRLGVRDLELVNKFDNALAGVAFDRGPTGVAINAANKLKTGHFWEARTCTGEAHDSELTPGLPDGRDQLIGAGLLLGALPIGSLPAYPKPPHCNVRGLTALGEHLIRRMIERGMILDTDHLSVLARQQALALLESRRYSGVVSSHSWSDDLADRRIYDLGGVIGPYAGGSTSYAGEWERLRKIRNRTYVFGVGFGPDMNGFGKQGGPRTPTAEHPGVTYPFKSFDGRVTFERQTSGQRVFDINSDGVAHYGLYPDWIEDLRILKGRRIVRDMARGSEAYLQMWERAVGVPGPAPRPRRLIANSRGLGSVRLGLAPEPLLRRAGQPVVRNGRTWRWKVRDTRRGRVVAALSAGGVSRVVLTSARLHSVAGIRPGTRVRAIRDRTRRVARELRLGPRVGRTQSVFVIRDGRVKWAGLVSPRVARSTRSLLRETRRART